MKRIKLTFGVTLLLLTSVSMLVTNIVILPFWIGDILSREKRHLQHLLVALPPPAIEGEMDILPQSLLAFIDTAPGSCLVWGGAMFPEQQTETNCQQGLQPLVAAAMKSGTVQTSLAIFSLGGFLAPRYLFVAVPVTLPGERSAVSGAGIPFSYFWQSLWMKEKIIAVYLLFNASIFAVLSFLRLLKFYIQPVDLMILAAENYRSGGLDVFLTGRPTNELGELAGSIRALVGRIEADKEKLAGIVKELSCKNVLLQENQRELIRAEKLATVGRLTAGLAHEIGNPLGIAQGYLQLLSMGNCSELERTEYTAKACRELQRVDSLFRRLLDYTRSEKGVSVRIDLHDLLCEIVEDLRGQPFLEGIQLHLDLQATMSLICVDPEQLRQVILNCVLNAADAINACTPPREGDGKISLSTELASLSSRSKRGRSFLRASIADNGVGIPEELVGIVFDPFFTTKEPGVGTGLGLSVSLGLVEAMGGFMDIQSAVGEGTTVDLLLPLVEEVEIEGVYGQ